MKNIIAIIAPGMSQPKFTRLLKAEGWIRVQPSVWKKWTSLESARKMLTPALPYAANVDLYEVGASNCLSGPDYPRVESKLA